MENKGDEFASNPFVALFNNVDTARNFAEGTRIGLESITSDTEMIIDGGGDDDDNDDGTQQSKSISNFNKGVTINNFLQRIFLITVDLDDENSGLVPFGDLPLHCIKLKELREECKGNYILSLENINQALYERLQIADPVNFVHSQPGYNENMSTAQMNCCETLLITYLSDCYCRINTEEAALKHACSSSPAAKSIIAEDKNFEEDFIKIADECRKLVISFTGTILLQPEIFPVRQPHAELLAVMMNSYSDPNLDEYINKLVESHTDQNDLMGMFQPLLENIWKVTERIALLHPEVFPLLNVLMFYSKHSALTWCLLKSKYWLPGAAQHDGQLRYLVGASFEHETILGRLLRITSIPDSGVPSTHFRNPSEQSESEMSAITDNIRQYIDTLVTKIHKFLHSLFQVPNVQHEVLSWIGLCLNTNAKRSQMFTDPTIVAGSGFFLNLTHVLLKFCEPFCMVNSKLLFKVDCRYATVTSTPESIMKPHTQVHAVGLDKYTPMVEKTDDMTAVEVGEMKFNFISEMFFVTHFCYKLGFVKMYEQYEELMKRLRKLSNVYQDALQQNTIQGVIENFKNDFENGMRIQLAVKAHLVNPTLADLALKFSIASGHWLVQQTLAGDEYAISKPRELEAEHLNSQMPPALTVIPEFIPENVGDTVKSLGYFNEESLERCQDLSYIMNFFAVFLGEKNRIKNPHLRAKLAECLAAFLPKEKSGLIRTNNFSFSYRKRAFEISPVVMKILPQSLLQLFVDIEFTGHTMEFDQKFMYRRYMYAVLEYIWKIPSYLSAFIALHKQGKLVYNEEKKLSTFPRFINLLVNDSTFLLDEALQHLVTIKGLEMEKANGEWDNLSAQDKQEKEKNLSQTGRMAEGYNTMAKETVHVICYITKEIDRPFVSHIMADSMAAFLNYFFVHLVGPKRKQLKVKDLAKYNFEPGHLVKNITTIYLQLGKHEDFCQAIAKDSRSYSLELFESAVEVLERLEGAHGMAEDLRDLTQRLETWHLKLVKAEEAMPEAPEEFIDPISCELMQQPVQLPSSGKIVCRSTIAKHLLSDGKDPFNRSPLQLDEVIPCIELEQRIKDWMKENRVEERNFESD